MNDDENSPADTPPAVLIVNDDQHALLALAAALEGGPWRVVTAASGLAAFKELLLDDFAAVVLDVQMPGLSGFEVAEMIRARPRCASTPLVFCSATARTPDDLFKGYELGAVDYLLTPVSPRVLRSKVKVFVDLYMQRRQLARTVAELQTTRETVELQNRELTRAATRDSFTGCLDRHGLELATAMLFDAARKGAEFSIVAVGLDRSGAAAEAFIGADSDADDVRRLARLLGAGLRNDDELCRWGEELFVVALAHTSIDEAARIAGQLGEKIRSAPGPGPSLAASIGVSSTAFGAATLEALVAQADLAMHAARGAGGNTVGRHDRPPGAAA